MTRQDLHLVSWSERCGGDLTIGDSRLPLALVLRNLATDDDDEIVNQFPSLDPKLLPVLRQLRTEYLRAERDVLIASLCHDVGHSIDLPSLPGPETLSAALRLAQAMSEASEEAYCAEWLIDNEYHLWLYSRHPHAIAASRYREEDMGPIRALHLAAGGWWRWLDERERPLTFVATKDWLTHLRESGK